MKAKITKAPACTHDYKEVENLAAQFDLHPIAVQLLLSRGIDTQTKIHQFLHADAYNMGDPFALSGMKEAVKRLKTAVQNGETVVVYGDYDVDGITATSILCDFLSKQGANVIPFIPDRINDGYGLNISPIEKLIEDNFPDLFVTCDCGISCKDQIEYIMDLGIDVIVTDHHEIPQCIPDCTVINPKLQGQTAFRDFCGAGVALKVVQAMGGVEACQNYFDLACIATVADMVALVGENRLIVQLGLRLLNEGKRLSLAKLMQALSINKITASDISFKLAPRINSAGRMGDATRGLHLLLSEDEQEITQLIKELDKDNTTRKEIGDRIFFDACNILKTQQLYDKKFIAIAQKDWEKGIIGITAARLVAEFKRPVLLMSIVDGVVKGTARSIEGINIYEVLDKLKEHLIDFGGHDLAAGFSLHQRNLEAFVQGLNTQISVFEDQLFETQTVYDFEISLHEVTDFLCYSMEKLEPFGRAHERPLFMSNVQKLGARQLKAGSPNLELSQADTQLIAFNRLQYKDILTSSIQKNIFYNVSVDEYAKRFKPKLYLRHFEYANQAQHLPKLAFEVSYLKQILKLHTQQYTQATSKQIHNLLTEPQLYGTLFVAFLPSTYQAFLSAHKQAEKLLHTFCAMPSKNNYTRILLCSEHEFAPDYYKNIIFLDQPLSKAMHTKLDNTQAQIYTYLDFSTQFVAQMDLSREVLGTYYRLLTKEQHKKFDSIFDFCQSVCQNSAASELQLCLSLLIFHELGIIKFTNAGFEYIINSEVKSDLNTSGIYKYLCDQKTAK